MCPHFKLDPRLRHTSNTNVIPLVVFGSPCCEILATGLTWQYQCQMLQQSGRFRAFDGSRATWQTNSKNTWTTGCFCTFTNSYHQTICAMESHSLALATFKIWSFVYIVPLKTLHRLCVYGCASACALKQKFAQCKIFLDGTLMWTLP